MANIRYLFFHRFFLGGTNVPSSSVKKNCLGKRASFVNNNTPRIFEQGNAIARNEPNIKFIIIFILQNNQGDILRLKGIPYISKHCHYYIISGALNGFYSTPRNVLFELNN